MKIKNLFVAGSVATPGEMSEILAEGHNLRIERIVSHGHSSPPGFWYDENQFEWVTLLSGSAQLIFEDEQPPQKLMPGDHLLIAAHRRHRVDWTSPDEPTIWLAVYFDGPLSPE